MINFLDIKSNYKNNRKSFELSVKILDYID